MPDMSSQDVRRLFDLAGLYHRKGDLAEAEKLYHYLALQQPGRAGPRHMLGVLCMQQGRNQEALALIGEAVTLDSGNAEMLGHYGHVLKSLGRFEEAVAAYDRALAARPDMAILVSRGNALRPLGRLEEALDSFDRALARAPREPGIWLNRGMVLSDLGRFEEALKSYDTALGIEPGHAGVLNNRALLLFNMGEAEEAIKSFDAIIARHPGNWEALNNRGLILLSLSRFAEALESYERALAIQPSQPDVLSNRGVALLELGRPDEAMAAFAAALALRPDHIDALNNRARQLLLLGRLPEALMDYERVLALQPDNDNALGGVAEIAPRLCDWPLVREIAKDIAAHVAEGKAGISPLCVLGYSDDARLQLAAARNHIRAHVPPRAQALWEGVPNRNAKIKLAYLSTDFQDHPVARLLAGLVEGHDRARFEVSAISLGGDDGSDMRRRLERGFDRFSDMRGGSDFEIARMLRQDRVDIAIDLNGHTRGSRPGILSYRPAPVQVNFLGYAGSMGADFMDYIIADPVIAPFETASFFAEKIVQLPGSHLPHDPSRRVAEHIPSRTEAGLPADAFVFASFNSSWKIGEAMFDVWMRLLNSVPGSVLWLPDFSWEANANLRNAASTRGIEPARLIFAPPVPHARHLARQGLADLFLDTLPFNAHSTASDALWAGLPLLTCRGESFPSRVAASLLTAIDLTELITVNLGEYERLALKLAEDRVRLKSIREKLWRNRGSGTLFDCERYRRNIEAAYIKMWEISERGEAPQSFRVEA
jgi:predicted O-linked N-acetylglucosamine transferase (SPINDLY family)